jgi:hypothetical protein
MGRTHRHLSFANVTSALALFIALGGTSYAAVAITGATVKDSSLTGADIKNESLTGSDVRNLKTGDIADGSLLAKDFKAGQLTAGAGPAGPKGDQGLKGDTGARGGTGAKGDQGIPGPYPDGGLPSGKTEQGVYGLADYAGSGTNDASTEISFPFPLASAPTPHFIAVGATPPAQCPGSHTNPQAQPGHLCIYETSGSAQEKLIFDPASGVQGPASRFGVALLVIGSANDLYSRGTWAVTAP